MTKHKKHKHHKDLTETATPLESKAAKLKLKFEQPVLKRSITMFEKTITNKQKIQATIVPFVKTDGTPATILGIPTWTVTNGLSTVEIAADGLSAFLVSSDTNGDTNYEVDASVDFGAGAVAVSANVLLHVTDSTSPSDSIQLTFADPVDK